MMVRVVVALANEEPISISQLIDKPCRRNSLAASQIDDLT
jgi:hypothetical protein